MKGKKLSPKHKEKFTFKGHKHTEETKKKISDSEIRTKIKENYCGTLD
jgi:hypothetical protein